MGTHVSSIKQLGIIGADFVVDVKSFFTTGFLPKGVNSTILALIPKKEDSTTMKDFHPISCCNVNYKVISKILANLEADPPKIYISESFCFRQGSLTDEKC
mgnify:CR=1 FL=1